MQRRVSHDDIIECIVKLTDEALRSDSLVERLNEFASSIDGACRWVKNPDGGPKLSFGSDVSDIQSFDNLTISPSDHCYDLQGRRLNRQIVKSSNRPMKGLYVLGGKIVVIK